MALTFGWNRETSRQNSYHLFPGSTCRGSWVCKLPETYPVSTPENCCLVIYSTLKARTKRQKSPKVHIIAEGGYWAWPRCAYCLGDRSERRMHPSWGTGWPRKPDRAEPPSSAIRYYFSLGVRDGEKACYGKILLETGLRSRDRSINLG